MGDQGSFRFTGEAKQPPMLDNQIELRSASEPDLDDLARAGGFVPAYGRDDLRRDIVNGRCWLIRFGGCLIGQLAIRKDPTIEMSYLLARLLVDRRYRRIGLGRRLIAAMERSLDGNRVHAYSGISDSTYLQFLVHTGFVLSGYLKGSGERDTRLFFGKVAQARAEAAPRSATK
jgi:GNAT superfamily N-acetyltransferase